MNKEEVFAQLMIAFTNLPENVRKETEGAFKYVIEMLKNEDQKEGE